MGDDRVDFITYTKEHSSIVKSDIKGISEILRGTDTAEKRSLLFCLDKYLDPYYGYNLPFFDDIITLLQEQLFITDSNEVKEDILQLLRDYAKESLDYLAGKIEALESRPELLVDALYALGNTYNHKYIPVLIGYESHYNPYIRDSVKEILKDLSESNALNDK